MKRALTFLLLFGLPSAVLAAEVFTLHPISHASFVLEAGELTIYVDPVGDAASYSGFAKPDMILITHIHGDHLAPELVAKLQTADTQVVGPPTVIEQLGCGEVLKNGESLTYAGLTIEAIPAYNTTEERLTYHPRGRDNGYVLTRDGQRLYISGDSEDIPEMRALKDIDIALVCMNLPFTMTTLQAASAVNAFKPKVVIPYHYRGKPEMSDVDAFAGMVKGSEVRKLKWY